MRYLILPFLLCPSLALAQSVDPALCSKAVAVVVAQRNQAQDNGANSEARLLVLQDELASLKAELAKLKEPKPEEKK